MSKLIYRSVRVVGGAAIRSACYRQVSLSQGRQTQRQPFTPMNDLESPFSLTLHVFVLWKEDVGPTAP